MKEEVTDDEEGSMVLEGLWNGSWFCSETVNKSKPKKFALGVRRRRSSFVTTATVIKRQKDGKREPYSTFPPQVDPVNCPSISRRLL